MLFQSRNFVEPGDLFKNEVEESIGKVRTALRITRQFKVSYEEHRAKIADYFKDGAEPILWEFTPELVFHRYDVYLQRLEIIIVSERRRVWFREGVLWI